MPSEEKLKKGLLLENADMVFIFTVPPMALPSISGVLLLITSILDITSVGIKSSAVARLLVVEARVVLFNVTLFREGWIPLIEMN